MAFRISGQYRSPGQTDDDGYRTYTVTHLVVSDVVTDGPAQAMQTAGLPQYGDQWNFGTDVDLWAFCKQSMKAEPFTVKDQPGKHYTVEQTFTSKPDEKRCKDQRVDEPLLVPDRISFGFTAYQEEATHDRLGQAIQGSAFEQLRGPQVEFDCGRGTVKISQNRALLEYPLLASMFNTLNDAPLWGFPKRAIKFKPPAGSVNFYGQCYKYYERNLEFEVRVKRNIIYNADGTLFFQEIIGDWDRDLLDEQNKVLRGDWGNARGIFFGSGCQVEITEVDPVTGQVLDVDPVPTDGGSGYPRTADLSLYLIQKPLIQGFTPQGCVVHAITDAAGVVTFINGVMGTKDGLDYRTGVVDTPNGVGWCLRRVNNEIPDIDNPMDYERFKDIRGNPAKVVLNGCGTPIGKDEDQYDPAVGKIHVEKYEESNFLLLGIPLDF